LSCSFHKNTIPHSTFIHSLFRLCFFFANLFLEYLFPMSCSLFIIRTSVVCHCSYAVFFYLSDFIMYVYFVVCMFVLLVLFFLFSMYTAVCLTDHFLYFCFFFAIHILSYAFFVLFVFRFVFALYFNVDWRSWNFKLTIRLVSQEKETCVFGACFLFSLTDEGLHFFLARFRK
jgi:hypothetical protein